MKILLIRPPALNTISSEVPDVVRDNTGLFPPLGLMYLQAYLAKRSSHEATILDGQALGLDHEALARKVKELGPSIVGISAFTHSLVDVVLLIRAVRRAAPGIFLVLGGPHVSRFPGESISLEGVDCVVIGDGEIPLAEIADCLEKGGELEAVRGIRVRTKSGIEITPDADFVKDLDALPHPDRSRLDFRQYYNIVGSQSACATFVTARGCPFRCAFCDPPRGPWRARSPEDVVSEIEEVVSLGIREIYFVDDTFNVDRERAKRICELILARGIEITWGLRARVDVLDEELLRLFRKAGCTRIQFGVETGTDEGLLVLNKRISLGQVQDAFRWTRRAGISSMAYFLVGCPHEKSRDDVSRTIEFAVRLDPDMALFNILTPFPATPLYRQGVEKGVIPPEAWERYLADPSRDFRPPVWTEFLTREELFELVVQAYRRFYLRPRVVLRNLAQLNPANVVRKAKAALGILGMKKSLPRE